MKNISNIEFVDAVEKELARARAKFPSSVHSMTALTEEVGELAKALLHAEYEGGDPANVIMEAIQVAVMAQRIAVEGDASIKKGIA